MFILISWLLVILVSLPVLVVGFECLLGLLPMPACDIDANSKRPLLAVLVPAHNEGSVIEATVCSIRQELDEGDRLIVIADNCTDETSSKAAGAGAEVVERHDSVNRGKGYALAAGIDYLRSAPPDVVMVIDADCRITGGRIAVPVQQAWSLHRPVQCLNLVDLESADSNVYPVHQAVSLFAFMIKNQVRPRGLSRLRLSVPLHGTGMFIPWSLISSSSLASGDIVEDLSLGLDLLERGYGASACHDFSIRSSPPSSSTGALQQRRRWEHGYLDTLFRRGPRLVATGLVHKRLQLVSAAIDLMVPPLTLLAGVSACVLMISLATGLLTGSWSAMCYLLICLIFLLISLMLSWWRFARDIVPVRVLAGIPKYIIWKLPIYVAYLRDRERQWTRSER